MILQLLALLFSYLATPFGMFAVLLGFLLFMVGPLIPRVTGVGHKLANLHIWLGTHLLKRVAIVVSEHGDILMKRMHPEDIGTESIQFNDITKEFEDPHQAKSHWFGVPFAFANEKHGFLFSLRDAALGRRKKESEESDEMVIKATEQERSMYEVQGWVKGVLEFPAKATEFVNLNHVRQLVPGSELAEDPQRIETYYRHSREPYKSGAGAGTYIMLIVAIAGPFAAIWLLASQLGTQGGADSVTVVSGMLALTLPTGGLQRLKSINWYRILMSLALMLPLPVGFLLLALFVNPVSAVMLYVLMGIGFWFVPIFAQLTRPMDGLATSTARLFTKLGMLGYAEPVFVETPSGYTLREFSQIDDAENVIWHTFLGRMTGFAFESDPELWGTEVADTDEIKTTAIADGGVKSNIPSGFSVIPEKQRAVYGVFVPSSLSKKAYYLWTGIALGRYKHVATGEKTQKRHEKAKEEYGGMGGMSNKTMIIAMSVLGTMSFLSGILVFFIL